MSGLNLLNYSDSVQKIDVVGVNISMYPLALKRIEKSEITVTNYVLSGEDLPMEDSSYDCVACTFNLCGIPYVSMALFEINRVLKRGGKLVFLDQGLSDTSKVQVWQHRINPLQRINGDRCHLNRDMDQIVLNADFEMKSLKLFQLLLMPKFIGHCYLGIAVKE